MKQAVLIVLFCLGITTVSYAADKSFEYYSLKSGMTKTEVGNVLNIDSLAQSAKAKYGAVFRDKSIDEVADRLLSEGISAKDTKALSGKDVRLVFLFTDKGLLWRLDVYINKPSDPARLIALDKAVRTRFKNHSIYEESSTSQYGTDQYFRIAMTDDNILNEAVERYTSKYLGEM